MKLNTDDVYIVNVRCNGAGTILMADTGILYAFGENNENKLGLGKILITYSCNLQGYELGILLQKI